MNDKNNMDKVTILFRNTFEDDTYGTTTHEYRVFPNEEKARELVIYLLCRQFSLEICNNTFERIANELTLCSVYCKASNNKIEWKDNGRGEEYIITTIDVNNNDCFRII